jgi:hypothetical protein
MNIDKSRVPSKNKTPATTESTARTQSKESVSAWTTTIVSIPATADMPPTAGPATERKIQQQQGRNAGMSGTIWTLTAATALPAAGSTAT